VSVLEEIRVFETRIVARLSELQPLVDEYAELQQAAARLGVEFPPAGRTRRSRKTSTRTRPGGTQATGAERRARVLELIQQRPGISVPEISAEIGVTPPPIYRVVRKLLADGAVKKDGKALQLA